MADFRPERTNFRTKGADFRPNRANFRLERVDYGPERADFWPERPDGGETNGQTRINECMNKRKSHCVLQDFVPFGAAAQKMERKQGRIQIRYETDIRSGMRQMPLARSSMRQTPDQV